MDKLQWGKDLRIEEEEELETMKKESYWDGGISITSDLATFLTLYQSYIW
jgi:hypothetical protein